MELAPSGPAVESPVDSDSGAVHVAIPCPRFAPQHRQISPVAMADFADRPRCPRHHPRDPWGTTPSGQLQQSNGPQNNRTCCTPPLSSFRKSFLSLVVTSMRNAARAIHEVCSKTFQNGIVLLEILQAVKDLVIPFGIGDVLRPDFGAGSVPGEVIYVVAEIGVVAEREFSGRQHDRLDVDVILPIGA